MGVTEVTGDLFTSEAPALGHGVNCQGLMGAGIALEFRRRWPEMHVEYRRLCLEGLLRPGGIYPYRAPDRVVINLATQAYPGPDARLSWLDESLRTALAYCLEREIAGLAIPRIGCGIGGLEWDDVRAQVEAAAERYPTVDVEVWAP